jgi:ribose-phosphate pyrophosphokinase
MLQDDAVLFSGSSYPKLAKEIALAAGIPYGSVQCERFPDGEISLELRESVRGKSVFVVQSVAIHPNEYWMELLILVDALRRASAKSIIAVMPYFGYSRQDRKDKPRVPITAKLVANLLTQAGVDRVVTMDLHTEQLQGFFDIPVDHLYARPLMVEAVKKGGFKNGIVVAPDIGSVKIARSYAEELGTDFAIVDKHRQSAFEVEVLNLIGDVQGKDVLLADDICSTAGTLESAAKACHEKGANKVYAAITHGLFVGDALEKINASPIEILYCADTIPLQESQAKCKKLQAVSCAGLFGRAVQYTLSNKSIASLFDNTAAHSE